MGGPKGALGAFWLILELKGFFDQYSIQNPVLIFLKICLYFKTLEKLISVLQK